MSGPALSTLIASDIIARALKSAGNTGLSTTDALDALNLFLQAEYYRKYWWLRTTSTLPFAAGNPISSVTWDTNYVDLYQQADGSCGRYTVPDSPGYIAKTYALDYRGYINRADRLTSQGPPQRLVNDRVGTKWYVWPVPDRAYNIDVDYYYLPRPVTLDEFPAWNNYAPVEILVQVVKVWALEWMQDDRFVLEKKLLYGDDKAGIPGMLPTYRRRIMAEEGKTFQTALDQRVFRSAGGWDDSGVNTWD